MTKTRQAYQDARRLREIVSTLFDAGFSSYVDAAKLRYLVSVRARLRRPFLPAGERERLERPVPVRVREAFERLGPTFVKFGQMLSLRPDLVGEEYCEEFSKLQEGVARIPYAEVARTVEEELGRPIAKAFVSFERRPIAAASLAQVHKATISGKRVVAVKVQRRGARETIEWDIHLMLLLAHLLERSLPSIKRYRPVGVVREFAEWTLRELDFTVEGASIDRFRADLRDDPEVAIPTVHWSHTRTRVITADFLEGRTFAELVRGRKAGDRELRVKVAGVLVRTLFRMYFVDGFFQADPHPGNYRVLKDGRLAMFDFGMVGYLTTELRSELLSCFMSLINKDADSYAKHVIELAEEGPEADVPAMKRDIQGVLDRLMYPPIARKGSVSSFAKAIALGARHDLHFPSDLALFARSIMTAEGVATRLDPKLELDAALRPFLDEALRRQLDPTRIGKALSSNAFDYLSFVKTLPDRTIALLRKAESGEFGVKLDLDELADMKEEFDRENDIRVTAIVAAALFVGAALLIQGAAKAALWGAPLGELALLTSFALFLWTAFQVMHRPR